MDRDCNLYIGPWVWENKFSDEDCGLVLRVRSFLHSSDFVFFAPRRSSVVVVLVVVVEYLLLASLRIRFHISLYPFFLLSACVSPFTHQPTLVYTTLAPSDPFSLSFCRRYTSIIHNFHIPLFSYIATWMTTQQPLHLTILLTLLTST